MIRDELRLGPCLNIIVAPGQIKHVDPGTCISWQSHCHQMGLTVGGVVVNVSKK